MRIASLVPSATELIFAMGLGEDVVAVTHECDFPPAARALPQLTRSVIPAELPPGEVDALVRGQLDSGEALYTLDHELLTELQPELIVAQQLCDVCAVPIEDLRALAERLPNKPPVISLDPTTLGEVLGDIRTIAQATDRKDAGVELLQQLADRIDAVKIALKDVGRAGGPDRVTTLAIEWLDPIFLAGHWVPQLLELAGGFDPLGMPGEPSRESDWSELASAEAAVAILMQCGYDAAKSAAEAAEFAQQFGQLELQRVLATDANAYFSRPGPRLVDGLEQLAHALHPQLVAAPAAGAMLELEF